MRVEVMEKRQAQMEGILRSVVFQIGVLLPVCKNNAEQLVWIAGFLRDVARWFQPSKN